MARNEYNDELQGVLYKNDKRRGDNDPPYRGSIQIAGVEYWASMWLNTSQDGVKYWKLRFTPKDEPRSGEPRGNGRSRRRDEFEDERPRARSGGRSRDWDEDDDEGLPF